jgi:hypothetical protein
VLESERSIWLLATRFPIVNIIHYYIETYLCV